MNLPVSSTGDYVRHGLSKKKVKIQAFFLGYRDNILNNRDQRIALAKKQSYQPTHHEKEALLQKRIVVKSERYNYRAK
ncbi:hypothetical protein PT274_01220 [Leuconostocaceae bacterium ESL0958]|nr:hypothetical protein [Leuconostocaceae bacterium ESL0958]